MNSIHKLNLNDNPSTFKDGEANDARNIVATRDQKAIRNEDGFLIEDTHTGKVIGTVEIPDGYVLFIKDLVNNNDKIVSVINGVRNDIESNYFKFTNLITGRYTFNSKNDLIIIFSEGVEDSSNETRMINLTYFNNRIVKTSLTEAEVKKLDLIPNIVYPTLSASLTDEGSMLIGTVQIAISYMIEESVYTNFSPLSVPIYIFDDLPGTKIGLPTNRGVLLNMVNLDSRYTKYKIGILYKGEDAFEKAYETDDIPTSVISYKLSNLDSFALITIDDLTINSISYIKDNAAVSFEGRYLRGNVKTVNYTGLDDVMNNIASKVLVRIATIGAGTYNPVSEPHRYMKEGEQYVIYLGCIDYKGNLVNAYPIPWKNGDHTELAWADSNRTVAIHKMPYIPNSDIVKNLSNITCTLPVNVTTLLGGLNNTIASFVYFYAEHNLNNSKILGQGFSIRDIDSNKFNESQKYQYAFKSISRIRWYSFEHLFNKTTISNCSVYGHKPLGHFIMSDYLRDRNYFKYFKEKDVIINNRETIAIPDIKYVHANNVVDDNIAGDSFHRLVFERQAVDKIFGSTANQLPSDHDDGPGAQKDTRYLVDELVNPGHIDKLMSIFEIVSNSDYFYSDLYKQKLVICSSIISKTSINPTTLVGDWFYGRFDLRCTTPSINYRYGEDPSAEDEEWVFKVAISVPIESRYNMRGRYNGVNDYQKIGNMKADLRTSADDLFNVPYKHDNFINTPEGKGYSLSCNNNGYDNIIIEKILEGRYHFSNRIIRSNVNSSESIGVPWMIFKADSYKDVDISRGGINILEADQQNVYIQQEFTLTVASVRDQLSNSADNTTYLGSSDLFNRNPYEVLFDKTGYLGCDNRLGGIMTLLGYFVVDSIRKNIYLIRGITPKKLNDVNTESWFYKHLKSGLKNPYDKNGIAILYDDTIKSIFLTQQCGADSFTIHYNAVHDGWLAFHDYIPEAYFKTRVNSYCLKDGKIYKRNCSNKAIYFTGYPNASYVSYIYAAEFETYKQICAIMWDTVLRYNNTILYDETFDSLMIYNDTQCTGMIDTRKRGDWFNTEGGVYKKDSWFFNDILDIVINDKIPFIDAYGSLIYENLNDKKDWFTLNNFLCKYIFIKFVYNNLYTNIVTKSTSAIPQPNCYQLDLIINSFNVNAIKALR